MKDTREKQGPHWRSKWGLYQRLYHRPQLNGARSGGCPHPKTNRVLSEYFKYFGFSTVASECNICTRYHIHLLLLLLLKFYVHPGKREIPSVLPETTAKFGRSMMKLVYLHKIPRSWIASHSKIKII